MNDALGINSVRMENAITELRSQIEVVHEALSTISDCCEEAATYFKGDAYNAFKDKADKYKYNFPIVESNLMSYVEDLSTYLNNYLYFEGTSTTN